MHMFDILPQLIIYLREYGLWLLSLAIILQCNGIPTGANIMVMAAGAFSFAGEINMIFLSLTVFISNIVGDLSSYYLWKYLGSWILLHFPRLQGHLDAGLAKAGNSFEHYGFLAVVFTRFPLSAFALVTNIVAGMTAYKLSRFIMADAIGEMMWSSFNLGVGYWFGDSWEEASALVSQFGWWLFLVLTMVIVFYLFARLMRQTKYEN